MKELWVVQYYGIKHFRDNGDPVVIEPKEVFTAVALSEAKKSGFEPIPIVVQNVTHGIQYNILSIKSDGTVNYPEWKSSAIANTWEDLLKIIQKDMKEFGYKVFDNEKDAIEYFKKRNHK